MRSERRERKEKKRIEEDGVIQHTVPQRVQKVLCSERSLIDQWPRL